MWHKRKNSDPAAVAKKQMEANLVDVQKQMALKLSVAIGKARKI